MPYIFPIFLLLTGGFDVDLESAKVRGKIIPDVSEEKWSHVTPPIRKDCNKSRAGIVWDQQGHDADTILEVNALPPTDMTGTNCHAFLNDVTH